MAGKEWINKATVQGGPTKSDALNPKRTGHVHTQAPKEGGDDPLAPSKTRQTERTDMNGRSLRMPVFDVMCIYRGQVIQVGLHSGQDTLLAEEGQQTQCIICIL